MKVSEMSTTDVVKDGDVLMIVQDGASKQIPASKFVQAGQTATNAEKLNGYTDEDFVKVNERASDTERVGGIPAENMATKDYVDGKSAALNNWTWCCPQLWFDSEVLPNNNDSVHYSFCDGRTLNKNQYHELFTIIGYQYSQVKEGDLFQIPDMMGRFALGSYTKGNFPRQTVNLPYGLYQGDDFTPEGQFKFPNQVGVKGGDPTTTQVVPSQIAEHQHFVERAKPVLPSYVQSISNSGSGAYAWNDNQGAGYDTAIAGSNNREGESYPPNDHLNPRNTGMLSMPPYLTFAYIMQIKPF